MLRPLDMESMSVPVFGTSVAMLRLDYAWPDSQQGWTARTEPGWLSQGRLSLGLRRPKARTANQAGRAIIRFRDALDDSASLQTAPSN